MSTHNICFLWRNKKKNLTELSPNKILILNNSCVFFCLFVFVFFFFSLGFFLFFFLNVYHFLGFISIQ